MYLVGINYMFFSKYKNMTIKPPYHLTFSSACLDPRLKA